MIDHVSNDELINELTALRAENDRLREALMWYGDRSKYVRLGVWSEIEVDNGDIARAALEHKP